MLGGLTPEAFMRRHWQKRPLLVRQAFPSFVPPLSRSALFALAGKGEVESRLIERPQNVDGAWSLSSGPFRRGDLPPVKRKDWTLLVQGVNLHDPMAHALMAQFRFIPDARLDDLMISWASEGGGVGPHFDSYDVFLIQAAGRRRWRIGRMPEARMLPDQPIKLIDGFVHEQEWILEPGDMLYLPPGWAHDGDAVDGECMTCSVGFRAARKEELVREVLLRLADAQDDRMQDADEAACAQGQGSAAPKALYADPGQAPTDAPARIPDGLLKFARAGLQEALRDPSALACALGEYLSEPKAQVDFRPGPGFRPGEGVSLHRKTVMLYDEEHVFVNGEATLAGGRDALLLRRLADQRFLNAATVARASRALKELLDDWCAAGWIVSHGTGEDARL